MSDHRNITQGSGERPGFREAIRRTTDQLVKGGTRPDKAREIAKDTALRTERGDGVSRR